MISIITATYNRSYIIGELYNSLCRQTSYDFEWIVVDDGSTDNIKEIMSVCIKECTKFPIYFFQQPNGGKHRAVNRGIGAAKGDYCFIVDSDDMLSDDAIETVNKWWSQSVDNQLIAAVSGLRGGVLNHGKIGDFPKLKVGQDYIDVKNTQRRRYNLLGDKAEVYRTALLKEHPFKCFDGENFMSEKTVWDELAYEGYYVRWYNKVIYYCEYLNDGLTKSGDEKEIRNFNGFTYYTQQRIKCNNLLEGIIARGYYLNVAKKKGLNLRDASRNLGASQISLVFSYLIWLLKNILIKL